MIHTEVAQAVPERSRTARSFNDVQFHTAPREYLAANLVF